MELVNPICPECGEPAVGTCDTITGTAYFDREAKPRRNVEYSGDTDVDWNDQKTIRDDKGHCLVTCDNGHRWYTEIKGLD